MKTQLTILIAIFCMCPFRVNAQTYAVGENAVDLGGNPMTPGDIYEPGPNLVLTSGGFMVDAYSSGRFGMLPTHPDFEPIFRFSVDASSIGGFGTDVWIEAGMAEAHTDVFETNIVVAPELNFQIFDGDSGNALGILEPSISMQGVNGYDISVGLTGRIYWSVDVSELLTATYAGSSAADIFVQPAMNGFAAFPVTFATAADLGLDPNDEIDALEVWDRLPLHDFAVNDRVLFSLAPGSPTLASLGLSAADIIVARPGQPPALYAPAKLVGLRKTDNLNALSVKRYGND